MRSDVMKLLSRERERERDHKYHDVCVLALTFHMPLRFFPPIS